MLGIGDQSGSHSEDYVLNCYRLDPTSGQEVRVFTQVSGGFGQYQEVTKSLFKKGTSYTFQIDWQATNLTVKPATSGSPAEGPDFDYTFKVQPQGSLGSAILIPSYDPKARQPSSTVLLAESANDVATTEEEFKEKYESLRVALVAMDLDIEYGSQAGIKALDESKEDIGDGGYISLKSQTHQGEDITPTTYLVIRPTAGLSANEKVRLSFNSGGGYKLSRNRLGTDLITNDVTEFPAGQETRLYLVGETKSQTRGGEQITMRISNSGSWVDGDSLKATVVQTQFQIDLRVFIPYNWVNIPFHPQHLNEIAKGDHRSYDPDLNGTYRVAQRAILNIYPEWVREVRNRLVDDGKWAGLTEHFNTNDVTNFNLLAKHSEDTAVTPSYINPGAPHSNSGTADLSQVDALIVTAQTNDDECFVRFKGSAQEPIILGAAAINWELNVGIIKIDPLNPKFAMGGKHDGFPSYEIYLNSKHLSFPYTTCLQWKPPLNVGVLELSTNLDVSVGPTIGIINK